MLAIAAACGDRSITTVVHRDSAGIRIVETPGDIGRAPIEWIVGKAPDLQLGSAIDDGPEQFHGIGKGWRGGGTVGFPDRRIVVVDGASGELRFFTGDGRFLNRSGGLGDGPGEFRSPRPIPYASNDSLLVFDGRQRRFTLFSTDGKTYRNFPFDGLPSEFLVGGPHGASDYGILTTTALSGMNMNDGQNSTTIGVRWITLKSKSEKIVAEYEIPGYMTHDFGYAHQLTVPFNVRPSGAVSPRGFFVTGGVGRDVREFDNSGQLIRIIRLVEAPRSVKPEDVESAVEDLVSSFTIPHSLVRAVYKRVHFPNAWPTFQSVRIDRLGWLWVELYRARTTDAARWMVFDSTGVARGTVELPADLEVHDIGRDYVLGRWLDSMRVEYVRRYRLDRAGENAQLVPQ